MAASTPLSIKAKKAVEDQSSSDDADSEDDSSDDEWVSLDKTAEFAVDY
jgi:hypothetical protein